jgi:hypothetical protein
MKDLLRLCASFKVPTIEELNSKFVNFGVQKRGKVLILDMDETLIHARYLTTPE